MQLNSHLPRPRFPLGRILATRGVIALGIDLRRYLYRHERGDWGDLPPEDAQANERDLLRGGRLISAYQTPAGRILVITEADRCATTLLLPEEY